MHMSSGLLVTLRDYTQYNRFYSRTTVTFYEILSPRCSANMSRASASHLYTVFSLAGMPMLAAATRA